MGQTGWALTFVSPEDGTAWRKLRRLGAPDLPHVDVAHLLAEGGWRYLEAAPAQPAGPARVAAEASPAVNGRDNRARRRGGRRRGGRGRSGSVKSNL
jgi:hypothetical protein